MSSFNALHHHIRNIRANIFNHGWELDLQNQFVEIAKARLADHTNSTISDDQSDNDNHAGNAYADIPIDDSDDEWLLWNSVDSISQQIKSLKFDVYSL